MAAVDAEVAAAAVVVDAAAVDGWTEASSRSQRQCGVYRQPRRSGNNNRITGSLFYTFGNSALNARPFSVDGLPAPKAAYSQNRFGVSAGGPLAIPKLFNFDKDHLVLQLHREPAAQRRRSAVESADGGAAYGRSFLCRPAHFRSHHRLAVPRQHHSDIAHQSRSRWAC